MFKLKDLKSEKLKRSTSRIILYAILDKASFENKSSVKIGQTYLSENYCISTKTVGKELKYLQEQGYITYKRALYNNLTTTEITLTEKSIALISRPQADVPKTENKPSNKPVKTEADQPQADGTKASNKPQNKPVKTEPRQPQAEAEKTPQQAEVDNKVTCRSVEEVLDLLNYQAQRFADGKQNEFEFRRVAKYIVSENITISQNIRYIEKNNKFVNVALDGK